MDHDKDNISNRERSTPIGIGPASRYAPARPLLVLVNAVQGIGKEQEMVRGIVGKFTVNTKPRRIGGCPEGDILGWGRLTE
jgi:hypothetical protein